MTTALTLPQRAAVALGTAEHEIKLRELVKASANILTVTNVDGREEAHRAAMNLRTARTTIQKVGKDSRDDATKFSKAIIAEEDRLIAIIEPEEGRVLGLRDKFDEQVAAEKAAKIAAERARVDAIKADIQAIRNIAVTAVGKHRQIISAAIDIIEEIEASEDRFAEFAQDAAIAIGETMDALVDLHSKAIAAEVEAARQQAEREAAEAKAKADREELAAAQAKLKADQEAAAAQQAALCAEIEKNAAIERAAIAEQQRIAKAAQDAAKAEQDRIAAEHAQKMADQQAAMDARQRDLDHAEALQMNAQFDIDMAAERQYQIDLAAEKAQKLAEATVLEQETTAVAAAPISIVEPLTVSYTEVPTLTLGKIGARLGFSLTADFLRTIGFEPAGRERAAVLYHENDWQAICAALIARIDQAREIQKQAA